MMGRSATRYQILSRLGEGGMGEVFLAHDSSLDRKVALKFIAEDSARDPAAHRRLLREAHAVAKLDHPYVCRVYEVADEGDRPFIAMEYVDGPTLKARLASGSLPQKEAIRVAIEIAEALDFAHRRGILHRDLKPGNVMIGSDGHVRVVDFGVAKHFTAGSEADLTVSSLTAPSEVAGTVAYMSPEQLRGEPLDARSDVFSFGLLLYEMLTGRHPFAAPTVMATAQRIIAEPEAPLEQHLPQAPPLLAHILKRCLEKDRSLRYASLRDVQIELASLLDGSSTSGRPVHTGPRHTQLLKIAAAVMVLALVGTAAMVWRLPDGWWLSEPALAFAERDWIVVADVENLTRDPLFDRSIRLALGVAIAQSKYVNVLPDHQLQAALRRMQQKPGTPLDETLAADLAVRENIRAVLACSIAEVGGVYALTARLIDPATRVAVLNESAQAEAKDKVLDALDGLSKRVRQRLGESLEGIKSQGVPLPLATTRSLEALKLYADAGRAPSPDAGQELLRQAIALDPDFALAHAELGRSYYLSSARERRLEGDRHLTRALEPIDRLTTRERLWIRATADDSRGLRADAAQGYENYLAQYPDDGRAWFRLGWTRMAGLGQYQAAITAFERVIALNPRDGSAHVNLAASLSGMGRFSDALATYRKAFELEPSFIDDLIINHEYGVTLVKAGDIESAATVFRKAIASPDSARQARGRRSLALLEMYRGRYGDAVEGFRQAVLLNQRLGSTLSEFRDRLFLTQALSAKRATRAAAVAELQTATALGTRLTLGPDWLHRLGRAHAQRGNIPEAKRILRAMEKTAYDAATDSAMNRNTANDRAQLDVVRAEIALAEGRAADAIPLLESHVVGDPDHFAVEPLARAYTRVARRPEAIKHYEQLLAHQQIGGEDLDAWLAAHLKLGDLYQQTGRTEDARKLYDRLASLWKDADADLDLLLELRQRLGR